MDLDPDIVAAMDDDFDFTNPENELDDDFVIMANQPGLVILFILVFPITCVMKNTDECVFN